MDNILIGIFIGSFGTLTYLILYGRTHKLGILTEEDIALLTRMANSRRYLKYEPKNRLDEIIDKFADAEE